MNHVGRIGRAARVLVVVAVAGAGFGIATAVQAAATPTSSRAIQSNGVIHVAGTQLMSNTDTNFNLAPCWRAPCTSHHTVTVTCPTGDRLLSGGVTNVGESSGPFGNGGDVEVHQSYPVFNQYGQTWAVDLTSIRGATHVDATAWAVCST
jgi:hypothetical protein